MPNFPISAEELKNQYDQLVREYQQQQYHNIAPSIRQTPKRPVSMLDMIAMRLNIDGVSCLPFEFINAYRINDERSVVFLVQDGQAQMLEDDSNLFPSDALITKLRLLMK